MFNIINSKLGESRGKPRIWVEGEMLSPVFNYGDKLSLEIDNKTKRLVFFPSKTPNTKLSVSKRVNPKTKKVKPLIEIKDERIAQLFNVGNLLRIVLTNGKAVVSLHGNKQQEQERLDRIISKVKNKTPLAVGSLFAGAGILDAAIKEGFKKTAIALQTALVIEREPAYLSQFLKNHRASLAPNACVLQSEIQNVEIKKGVKLDMLVIGLPCTAASQAGYTKNALKEKGGAEAHDDAGDLFFYFLQQVKLCQPAIIKFECVPQYEKTAGYIVIKSVLSTFGYDIQDRIVSGNEFGDLENRERLCMVATTTGLNDLIKFDINDIPATNKKPDSIAPYILEVDPESEEWKEYDYLVSKEVSDKEAGKGFKRDIYTGNETKVTTIRRLYHKAGSCDQYLAHPTKPNLWRKFRAVEHGAFKGVPPYLYEGLSETIAHECLGQSITFNTFVDVAKRFSERLGTLLTMPEHKIAA